MRVSKVTLGVIPNNYLSTNNNEVKNQTNYSTVGLSDITFQPVSFGSKRTAIASLLEGAKEIGKTLRTKALLEWERDTMDIGGSRLDELAGEISKIELLKHEQTKSSMISTPLSELKNTKLKTFTDFQKALVRAWSKSLAEAKNVPPELVEEKSKLVSFATNARVEAKKQNDFKIFEPFLVKMFTLLKKEATYINPNAKPLDTMLDYSGYTAEEITKILADLRKELVPIAKQIIAKSKPNTELLNRQTNPKQWQEFALEVAQDMGIDMSKTRLGKTSHSFMSEIDLPNEIGIAITERDPNIRDCIKLTMSFLHESGHGLVGLGSSPKLFRTGLTGATMDLHESQSRLWENLVGRSKEFWQYYFPKLQAKVDGLSDVKFEDFYNAVNTVECSPIRIKSDEVTYNLHIALRHEIENELLKPENTDKDIEKLVSELPQTWNKKMEEYLGITPKNDSEGVLQDVHWAQGYFGYFPSYGLGNLMAAQIMNTAKKEIPDLEKEIASGELKTLGNWLKEKIYKYGQTYTSAEVMQRVTGEPLNPKYFVEYLKTKYL